MADSTIAAGVQMTAGGNKLEIATNGSLVIGDVTITTDASGNLIFTGLPTADPSVAGALYSNAGVVTVSAG